MITLAPSEVPTFISQLNTYTGLRLILRDFQIWGIVPPPDLRTSLKEFENQIPSNPFQFINTLVQFPYLVKDRGWPIATFCPMCNADHFFEWKLEFYTTPLAITCKNCGEIIALNLGVLNLRQIPSFVSMR